tara:strand:- start:1751 stop:2938 length:1188 start_codon:yes stop_codon:yes gene_type:complete
MIRSVKSFDLKGQTILMRLDLNVPIHDDKIEDDFRIRSCLPTLNYCLESGASIVIMSHLGRPEGQYNSNYSLITVGESLAAMLEIPIKFSEDCISQSAIDTSLSLKAGEVHLLENLRFHKEEQDNDPEFSNRLSRHGKLFINDAFGMAHRKHASNFGIVDNFKYYGIGLLIEKELQYLKSMMNKPKRPLAVLLGGAKVSTKIELIKRYLYVADKIVIGGGMAFTFFKAMGYNVGKSLVEQTMVKNARLIIDLARASGKELILPIDVVCSKSLGSSPFKNAVDVREIPNDFMGLDIGPKSIRLFNQILDSSSTVIWNGPMGVFENNAYSNGTKLIAENLSKVCEDGAIVIAGGGDTSSALKQFDMIEKITHVSTGGGSSLELISGNNLMALERLEV